MLLGSLSVQSAVLCQHQLELQRAKRQQQDDRLSSTAHQLASALQGPYRCLWQSPSESWQSGGFTADCPADQQPQQLIEAMEREHDVRIQSWSPSLEGGVLRLQVRQSGLQRAWQLEAQPAHGLREVAP